MNKSLESRRTREQLEAEVDSFIHRGARWLHLMPALGLDEGFIFEADGGKHAFLYPHGSRRARFLAREVVQGRAVTLDGERKLTADDVRRVMAELWEVYLPFAKDTNRGLRVCAESDEVQKAVDEFMVKQSFLTPIYMEGTVQNPLTTQEMEDLADQARGFYGPPHPDDLLQAMLLLDPAKPDDREKLQALKEANDELKRVVGRGVDHVHARVRELLGRPQSRSQDEDKWYYSHTGMM